MRNLVVPLALIFVVRDELGPEFVKHKVPGKLAESESVSKVKRDIG